MDMDTQATWAFRLFVSGKTAQLDHMFAILKQIFEEHIAGQYTIEVIDVVKDPERAAQENILATPTLLQAYPQPGKRIIGELTDKEKIVQALRLEKQ